MGLWGGQGMYNSVDDPPFVDKAHICKCGQGTLCGQGTDTQVWTRHTLWTIIFLCMISSISSVEVRFRASSFDTFDAFSK